MARKITNAKKGVAVKISGQNSQKIIKVIKETRRTFAAEVNFGVEWYTDKKLIKDDEK